MGLFSKKNTEVKSVSTNVAMLSALSHGNQIFVEAMAYRTNPYVRRAVDLNAASASSVPAMLMDAKGNEIESPNHPLRKLMDRPNKSMGWKEYVDTNIRYLGIYGETFIYMVRTIKGIEALHPISSQNVTVQPSNNILDPVAYYTVNMGNGSIRVNPENMIHIKYPNPKDPTHGLSPMTSAADAIMIQAAIREWNISTTKNGANPSMELNIPYEMTKEQFDDFKKKFDAGYGGPDNANKVLILDGGKTSKVLGFNARDMDYANAVVLYAREVSIAYGVPPEKIGDSANKTYSNSIEANKEYANDTVMPLLDMFYSAHNRQILPLYKDVAEIKYDIEKVPGLKGDQTQQYIALNSIDFMSINEKRALFGYDDLGADADVILVPMGKVPLNEATEPLPKPPMGE